MTDNVRQQPHYAHGIEPMEYMQSRFTPEEYRGWLAGNVIKYVSRFTRKDGVRDLEKAQDYLERLIAHEQSPPTNTSKPKKQARFACDRCGQDALTTIPNLCRANLSFFSCSNCKTDFYKVVDKEGGVYLRENLDDAQILCRSVAADIRDHERKQ